MNYAHLHLIVNHFPIIGMIFGLGILITGIVLKNNTIKNVSYVLFVIAAIFAAASVITGERAEEIVEKLTVVVEKDIETHEEIAEKLALILYTLGVVSLLGLYLNFKKHSKANLISFLALTIAVVGIFVAKEVATTGGEIRHSEIREGFSINKTENNSQEEES